MAKESRLYWPIQWFAKLLGTQSRDMLIESSKMYELDAFKKSKALLSQVLLQFKISNFLRFKCFSFEKNLFLSIKMVMLMTVKLSLPHMLRRLHKP